LLLGVAWLQALARDGFFIYFKIEVQENPKFSPRWDSDLGLLGAATPPLPSDSDLVLINLYIVVVVCMVALG
jgi:hypothetical protein